MNIYDISRRSGVSIATVSRVINGKPNVSDATRQRVLSVIEELGYVPNAFARGLGSSSAKTVGLMCLDVADLYLASAVSILERELRIKGYDALLCCTGAAHSDQVSAMRILLAKQVDAVVMIGSHLMLGDSTYIHEAAKQVPILLLNGYLPGRNIHCVAADDFGAILDLTTLLLRAGHEHILYTYDSTTYSGRQKRGGYQEALRRAGREPDERYQVYCEKHVEAAERTFLSLLRDGPPFTAAICSEDELAAGAVKAAMHLGVAVPRELEITGYNNSLLARCCCPEVTSVDSRVEALCMTAISILFGIFDGKDFPDKTILSTRLIQRGSTRSILKAAEEPGTESPESTPVHFHSRSRPFEKHETRRAISP